MEFGPKRAPVRMNRGIPATSIGMRVEVNIERAVTVQIGHGRFGVCEPFAKKSCSSQKCWRKQRISSRSIKDGINCVEHLDKVIDTVAVDVGYGGDSAAERHGGFFCADTLVLPPHFAGIAPQHPSLATPLGASMKIDIDIAERSSGETAKGPVIHAGLQTAPGTAFYGTAPFEFSSAIDANHRTEALRVFGGKKHVGAAISIKVRGLWTTGSVPSVAR